MLAKWGSFSNFDGPSGGTSSRGRLEYQRNNKSGGAKNLRCFPRCRGGAHKAQGYCGDPVLVAVAVSLLPEERCCRYCRFVGALRAAEAEPAFAAGRSYAAADVDQQLRSDKDLLKPLFAGELLGGEGEGTPLCVAFNSGTKGWHYGWRSTRHTSHVPHVFDAFVFETSGSDGTVELRCLGRIESPPFCVHSRRRAKTSQNPAAKAKAAIKAKAWAEGAPVREERLGQPHAEPIFRNGKLLARATKRQRRDGDSSSSSSSSSSSGDAAASQSTEAALFSAAVPIPPDLMLIPASPSSELSDPEVLSPISSSSEEGGDDHDDDDDDDDYSKKRKRCSNAREADLLLPPLPPPVRDNNPNLFPSDFRWDSCEADGLPPPEQEISNFVRADSCEGTDFLVRAGDGTFDNFASGEGGSTSPSSSIAGLKKSAVDGDVRPEVPSVVIPLAVAVGEDDAGETDSIAAARTWRKRFWIAVCVIVVLAVLVTLVVFSTRKKGGGDAHIRKPHHPPQNSHG